MASPTADDNSIQNLIETINSVAAGNFLQQNENEEDHIMATGLLEGTVLHFPNGQSLNVVQMDDSFNVVQVEATELDDGICEIDFNVEEQQHILSETGAHVVVNTESEILPSLSLNSASTSDQSKGQGKTTSVPLPSVPFSFPGQSFDIKCQKLILNVWDFFKRLKRNPDLLDEIRTPQERAAAALHISAATIGKIGKQFRKTGKLEAPGKTRNRAKPVVDSVDSQQEQVIREILKEMKDSRITPTLPILISECRERINYQGGATSFRRILQRMGYKGLGSGRVNSTARWNRINQGSATEIQVQESAKNILRSRLPQSKKQSSSKTKSSSLPKKSRTAPNKKAKAGKASSSHSSSSPAKSKQELILPSETIFNLSGESLEPLIKTEAFSLSQQAMPTFTLANGNDSSDTPMIQLVGPDNIIQQFQIIYTNE